MLSDRNRELQKQETSHKGWTEVEKYFRIQRYTNMYTFADRWSRCSNRSMYIYIYHIISIYIYIYTYTYTYTYIYIYIYIWTSASAEMWHWNRASLESSLSPSGCTSQGTTYSFKIFRTEAAPARGGCTKHWDFQGFKRPKADLHMYSAQSDAVRKAAKPFPMVPTLRT